MFRSLGLRSDLVVMSGLMSVEPYEGHVVLRTPDEPNYWQGNAVVVTEGQADPATVMGWFQAAFPDARHVVVKWDLPAPDFAELTRQFAETPLSIETFDTLTATKIAPCPAPPGILLRQLRDDDWLGLAELQAEVADEEGYDPAVHRPFLERRNQSRRAQIEQGAGQWFGAFDGDLIVGTMGAFHGHGIATIDAVETRASHRRRGICSALLAYVGAWLNAQAPSALIVIIAEADGAPGRLYQSRGFAHTETIVEVTQPGY